MITEEALTAVLECAVERTKYDLKLPLTFAPAWSRISGEIAAPFADAMALHPEIGALEGVFSFTPNEGCLISLGIAAHILIDRASDIGSVNIVNSLVQYARDRKINQLEVQAIDGVTVKNTIELDEAMSVVPGPLLPVGDAVRERLKPIDPLEKALGGWRLDPPDSGIVHTSQITCKHVEANRFDNSISQYKHDEGLQAKFRDARYALMLASNTTPRLRENFRVITTPGWPSANCSAWTSPGGILLHGPSSSDADTERVVRYYNLLRKNTHEEKLALACSRLSSARVKSDFVEQVVDLGTCLEILLMTKNENGGEITNKVSTRAAWLLGHTTEDRARIFKLANSLYQARSKAVHTGKISIAFDPGLSPMSQVDHFKKLCADIITAILDRDEWPDWQILVLGG